MKLSPHKMLWQASFCLRTLIWPMCSQLMCWYLNEAPEDEENYHAMSLTLQSFSRVPVVFKGFPFSNGMLVVVKSYFFFPSSVFCLTTTAATPPWFRQRHTHNQSMAGTLHCLCWCLSSTPTGWRESVLSGMAEYPGRLPPLLRYPSMIYFCLCVSLLSAKCLWCLLLHYTDERCQCKSKKN